MDKNLRVCEFDNKMTECLWNGQHEYTMADMLRSD